MLKFMSFVLLITFSAQSFSKSCLQQLDAQKRTSYFDRLSDDTQKLISFGSTVGGLAVGLTVASATLPAFFIAAGIASAPILVGSGIRDIQNRPIKRMMRLIHQSEALVNDPSMKPGGLLKRTHKKLQSQGSDISIEELAQAISEANNSNNCKSIHRVKDIQDNIESGILPVVEI